MFDRYTEKARRTIFFARDEASHFGASSIDAHHLLLGIAREYPALFRGFLEENLRQEFEKEFPRGPGVSTSVDLPLSKNAQLALKLGAEQADALGHRQIGGGHLLLGLLLVEKGFVGDLLRKNGIDDPFVRDRLRPDADFVGSGYAIGHGGGRCAASFQPSADRLTVLGREARIHLLRFTQEESGHIIRPDGWSRRQTLGHLIDWATTHHQWFARALVDPKLNVPGYPENHWVAAQKYQDLEWHDLVETWLMLNSLLTHVLSRIPEAKASTPCRVGIEEPMPLSKLAADYVAHCDDVLGEILKRG